MWKDPSVNQITPTRHQLTPPFYLGALRNPGIDKIFKDLEIMSQKASEASDSPKIERRERESAISESSPIHESFDCVATLGHSRKQFDWALSTTREYLGGGSELDSEISVISVMNFKARPPTQQLQDDISSLDQGIKQETFQPFIDDAHSV